MNVRRGMITSVVVLLSRRYAYAFTRRFQTAAFLPHAVNRILDVKSQERPVATSLYYLHNGLELIHSGAQQKPVLQPAPTRKPIDWNLLRWRCPEDQFNFSTTADLEGLPKGVLLNQKRASKAIEFGIGMKQHGYNMYVLGPAGAGKRTLIRNFLEDHSLTEPPASDWAYVYNFEAPDSPKALELPAGKGGPLKDDLKQLIEDIQNVVPAALKSEQHQELKNQAKAAILETQNKAMEELAVEAKKHDLSLIRTSNGFALAFNADQMEEDDLDSDHHIKPEKMKKLDEAIHMLKPMLDSLVGRFPELQHQVDRLAKKLDQDAAKNATDFLFSPLKERYKDLPGVIEHIDAVKANVIEHASDIHSKDEEDTPASFMDFALKPRRPPVPFEHYQINLIVDNNETLATGAPVIYEENPVYYNLIGKTEHMSQFGTYLTDFSLIKAGSLHRANGGYLVVNARDLLMKPFSWEALKRCLRSGTVAIESLGEEYGLVSTVSLKPEPIDLNVKVVILGDRLLYYLLCELDPEFNDLFKVAADFDDEMDRSEEACQSYAQMLATLTKNKDLKPLDKSAVCALIEQGVRSVGDQEKLSTHMRTTLDLLCEADYAASMDKADVISKEHVNTAIEQQIYRSDRVRELVYEQIRRGTIMVDIDGSKVGQINGLAVLALGGFHFGRPSRITATARLGKGKVIDIEREVELGGPSHSKGVMILSSFLSSNYAQDCPLSLSANLVFEQSYGMIDGDSASMAELCALLSALSNIPIKQGLAMTGSVNQFGEAQAIGGATEKIEGYFDVCKAKGIESMDGVLIPESNLPHLMLRPDVLEAVEDGNFSVFTYKNVNEALELLTGVQAGKRNALDGSYPEGSINYLVDQRLHEFAEMERKFAEGKEKSDELEELSMNKPCGFGS
jgi:predicted ATP-dependent protease